MSEKIISPDRQDQPLMSTIEYGTNGEIIRADYTKLDKFLDEYFIPKYCVLNKVKNSQTREITICSSIYAYRIQALVKNGKISEQEVNHIMEYLEEKNIRVSSIAYSYDEDFSNFVNSSTYKNSALPQILDFEKQIELFKEYYNRKNNKDKETKEIRKKLIESNLRLANYILHHFNSKNKDIYILKEYGIQLETLQSYAIEGLIYAIEKFNPNMGYKFSSYANKCILGYIKKGIIQESSNAHLQPDDYYRIQKCKMTIETEAGESIIENPNLIIDVINLYKEKYNIPSNKARERCRNILIMTAKGYQDEEKYLEFTTGKTPSEDPTYEDVMLSQTRKDLKSNIDELMKTLTPREELIIRLRYGFEDNRCYTYKEIGEKLNVTIAAVSQTEKRILKKAKKFMNHKI